MGPSIGGGPPIDPIQKKLYFDNKKIIKKEKKCQKKLNEEIFIFKIFFVVLRLIFNRYFYFLVKAP